tara:strand:- start:85 stop:1431 length:1347 start_codon:yes stop_codon:yes gene_type:complete
MALSFNSVMTNIPGVGERAYLFSLYRMQGGVCLPNLANTDMQCMYLAGVGSTNDSWGPGFPFEGLYPNVGQFISVTVGGQYSQCYKVLEILDEATFMTGTCVSCYNNGYAGNCSDAFLPYSVPGDPNGCLYNNTINSQGVVVGVFNLAGLSFVSHIQTDCSNCTQGLPPVFEPNMVVNCCDATETYQLSSVVLDTITGTGVNQIGVTNFTQAFRADLYIGGATTGYKCFHLKEDYPPFGPMAYTIDFDAFGKRDDCTLLNDHIINNTKLPPCCGTPPPRFEPNVLVNCCDPTESYQLTSALIEHITGTGITLGVNQLGINTFTQAFRADLSIIGSTTTGYKCWHLGEESQPFGPTAYQGAPGSPTVYDTCTLLSNSMNTPCCGGEPIGCPPPFTKLAKLTSKLDKFKAWKNKSLGGDGIITGGGKSGFGGTTRRSGSPQGGSSGGGGY